jgi:hypothetical protein
MKALFAMVASCLALSACSAPPMEPTEVGSINAYDFAGQNAYEVAEGLEAVYIPSEFREMTLPSTSGRKPAIVAVMPYDDFSYHEEHGSLRGYRGAEASDLFAFSGLQAGKIAGYKNLCVPTSFVIRGVSWMVVVSDGNRYGLRQGHGKGCKWALVLKDVAS